MEVLSCAATVIVGMLKLFTIAALHGKVQNFCAVLIKADLRHLPVLLTQACTVARCLTRHSKDSLTRAFLRPRGLDAINS